jgi:tRNA(Ile)-lysidine synthase
VIARFVKHIHREKLFGKNDKLLLAISGGVDSVVLAHLLKQAEFQFSLAHCNFNLRGKESKADEMFCKKLAEELRVKIFVKSFNVENEQQKNGSSLQMAARNLRYEWFKELIKKESVDFLVTAHHAGDVVETVLINLLRGTGIKGLQGIPQKNENIIRPLLIFTKDEILSFAKENKIEFRQDESNFEDKYDRNFLRLNVIPQLKKLNENLEQQFIKNTAHFSQEADIVNAFLLKKHREMVVTEENEICIDKYLLMKEPFKETLLHYIISPFGFNATQQKNILENKTAGKIFTSKTHILAIDREGLVIKAVEHKKNELAVYNSLSELKKRKSFTLTKVKKFSIPQKNEMYIDEKQLIFPLTMRSPKTGDKFKPFGMKGFKLLSNFFKCEKLNLFGKQNVNLLVNGNDEIIWVIGHRSDDRYKIDINKSDFLKLTFNGC